MEAFSDIAKSLTIEPDMKCLDRQLLMGHPHRLELKTLAMLWLFSTYFFVFSFQSVLLNTFFNVKAIPLANSLYDILHNKEVLISSRTETLETIKDDWTLTAGLHENFHQRRETYQKRFNFSFDKRLILLDTFMFKDIVEGRAVLLADSNLF